MAAAGLRERNKARRRLAIVDAALTLFASRGYDATTVADIADAAEVSPRTVALYFPSKQDMALAPFSEAAGRLVDALAARRPDQSTLDTLEEWLISEGVQPDPWDADLCERMLVANPELAALRGARMVDALESVRIALATDLRRQPTDLSIQVIVAASAGVVVEAATMRSGARRDTAVELAVQFLRAGIAALV